MKSTHTGEYILIGILGALMLVWLVSKIELIWRF